MNEIEASSDLRFRNLKDKQELGKEKACYCYIGQLSLISLKQRVPLNAQYLLST